MISSTEGQSLPITIMSEVIQITSKNKRSEIIESINTVSHRYKRLTLKIYNPGRLSPGFIVANKN